ncbi:MAG: hypothetical protein EZS28_022767 [Streblomastix strix]|uniref:Uncharacterized protein n=1 Tax=Streblomastix strix TaxID=222440 RepID=A0A5J4VGU9_9EUKA|nr:MAG: hypothetical protein EZS28_022767 [Streblomastix strix]
MIVDIPDIQGTIGQQTGLQPSSGAQSPTLSTRLKLKEAGSISANIMERTDPQINEGHEDNAEEEEDEQTDEAALMQNKDYRVNIISQPPVQENLGTQPQNNERFNVLSQMEKDETGTVPVEIQEKPEQGKGSKKTKIEGLNDSDEPSQSIYTQTQTQAASAVPKPRAAPKRGKKKSRIDPLIGQRHSNKGRSALKSPSGTEMRSALMRMAPQETKERIGELIYKEKDNGIRGKTK